MATPKIIIQKATAFQLSPDKSYIVHLPNGTPEDTDALQGWLREHGIADALIVFGEDFNITETPQEVKK